MSVVIDGVYVVLLGPALVALATRLVGVRRHVFFAVLHDALPWLLTGSWPALVVAVGRGDRIVAVVAATTALTQVVLVVMSARSTHPPRWAARAPRLTVAVANVYVDNPTFDDAARQLVEAAADVVVVVETTPRFRESFDAAGGRDAYPHRVFDADDTSEYAVGIYARDEPLELTMRDIGPLRVASALVRARGADSLRIVGAIPMAAVERGGYAAWLRQVRALARFAQRERGPLVVVGDLNSTTHRAAFADLRDAGLVDAHGALGAGLRPSFKLAASGVLGRLGGVARLDHALCNRRVWPLAVHDLPSAGSDHRPFVLTLAVHPSRRQRRGDGRLPDRPAARRATGVSAAGPEAAAEPRRHNDVVDIGSP